MDARETAGQGLRFELMKEPYTTGGYTIFTHDYRNYTPPGPSSAPASVKHWRSSSGAILPCSNGENVAYEVHYDLRNPLPRQIISTGELSKGAKGKRKAVSEDDDESEPYEPEEEEPTSPHLKKKQRPNPSSEFVPHLEPPPEPAPPITRAQSRAPVQEGGGAPPARVRSQRRAAIAANKVIGEDEDMSDDDHPIAMSKTSRSSRVRPRTVDSSESESERPAVRRRQVFDHVSIPPSPVRDAPTTRHCDAVRDDRHVYDNAGQPLGMAYETEERGRYEIQWTVPPVASSSRHPAAVLIVHAPTAPRCLRIDAPTASRLFIVNAPDARRLLERPRCWLLPHRWSRPPLHPRRGQLARRPAPRLARRPSPRLARARRRDSPAARRPDSPAARRLERPAAGCSLVDGAPLRCILVAADSPAARRLLFVDSPAARSLLFDSPTARSLLGIDARAARRLLGAPALLPGIATINDEVPMQRSSSPGPAEAEAQSAEAPDPTSEMMRLLGSMTPQQMQAMLGMMAQASRAAPQ
ncbi:hypothetical protein B0H14DRAFT_3462207 [Mycena olivaceomarginata]|nr:hypothetical protein B0H14DRAFT_3462207 [Mycena olivaceomarginata]